MIVLRVEALRWLLKGLVSFHASRTAPPPSAPLSSRRRRRAEPGRRLSPRFTSIHPEEGNAICASSKTHPRHFEVHVFSSVEGQTKSQLAHLPHSFLAVRGSLRFQLLTCAWPCWSIPLADDKPMPSCFSSSEADQPHRCRRQPASRGARIFGAASWS